MDPVTAVTMGAGIANLGATWWQNRSSAREASKQRGWQEYMSNTAYRRSTEDLREAGLNPILAVPGGASTPPGAMPDVHNLAGSAVSSAMAAKRMGEELKVIQQTERKLANDTRNVAALTEESYKRQDIQELEKRILSLQIPALQNAAKAQGGKLGEALGVINAIRGALLGGSGIGSLR